MSDRSFSVLLPVNAIKRVQLTVSCFPYCSSLLLLSLVAHHAHRLHNWMLSDGQTWIRALGNGFDVDDGGYLANHST